MCWWPPPRIPDLELLLRCRSRTQQAVNQQVSVSVCYLLAALGGNNLHSFKYLIQWFARDLQLHNQRQRSTLPKRVPPALLQCSFPAHSSSHGKKTRIHNFCAHIWGRMSHAWLCSHFQTGTICRLHVGPVCVLEDRTSQFRIMLDLLLCFFPILSNILASLKEIIFSMNLM